MEMRLTAVQQNRREQNIIRTACGECERAIRKYRIKRLIPLVMVPGERPESTAYCFIVRLRVARSAFFPTAPGKVNGCVGCRPVRAFVCDKALMKKAKFLESACRAGEVDPKYCSFFYKGLYLYYLQCDIIISNHEKLAVAIILQAAIAVDRGRAGTLPVGNAAMRN
ncbi:MAG TPA: hypothetical protein PLP08_00580 [Plasticicumulans sp.]|uniref:hypothetical protein n=1 Tax=Plasticicumulans sp. TaxID=2307179 RepID=UPI002CA6BFDB|nr:hypothetical protein [Plasticicumulans sp.]HMX52430.1 hypothetical protein [Plasticicumulans sp.]HNG48065.1 hypothetical protein [Plasticicumulans sp.]